ncbi:MAG: rhomboid family intramembrane serine protease, partial [Tannerella sp.]|nr:rhomboid family intramembrane serine protease [Tannerella sp.]
MMNRQGSGFWNSIPAVTKNLIIINILFWLASIVLPKTTGIDVTDWLGLHVPGAHHFNLIQIVSYMFLHDPSGVTHILFNMFAVWMFGRILEYEWGGKRFLIYYLVTGMGAGLVNIMVALIRIHLVERGMDSLAIESVYREGWSALSQGKNFIDPSMGQLNLLLNSTTIGASGAVFGILLAFGIKYP